MSHGDSSLKWFWIYKSLPYGARTLKPRGPLASWGPQFERNVLILLLICFDWTDAQCSVHDFMFVQWMQGLSFPSLQFSGSFHANPVEWGWNGSEKCVHTPVFSTLFAHRWSFTTQVTTNGPAFVSKLIWSLIDLGFNHSSLACYLWKLKTKSITC